MSGSSRTRRTTKDTGLVIYVSDGSTNPTWSSTTLSQRAIDRISDTVSTISGQHTVPATRRKVPELMFPQLSHPGKTGYKSKKGGRSKDHYALRKD